MDFLLTGRRFFKN